MGPFIHIITTRFNVPTENWEQTRAGFTPLTDEWHTHRFELFQKYTFPSFKNQTNKNFVWMVFFDVKTDEKYLKIIHQLQNEFPNFQPMYVTHGEEINKNILDWFSAYYQKETQFVISTDIDNDDIVHQDFVATVQNHFKPIHNTVIDLRRGLQMNTGSDANVLVNEYYSAANPFVSIVEDIHQAKTIMNERHTNFRNYINIEVFDKKAMFIQLIHTHNLMNNTLQTKGIYDINFAEFGIDNQNRPKISITKTALHNIKRLPLILKRLFLRK